jgi:23S rRNA (uridine2552-2'-O)-methyltransferase
MLRLPFLTRSSSSSAWITRQMHDSFKKKSIQDEYRNRAAYKLLQIDDKYSIFRKEYTVLDLGCSSGSWSQIATQRSKFVVGVDLLRIEPIDTGNHFFIQGDFNTDSVKSQIRSALQSTNPTINHDKFNVILSDMAPSTSGVNLDDHLKITEMNLNTVKICEDFLTSSSSSTTTSTAGGGGGPSRNNTAGSWFILKTFYGPETPKLVSLLSSRFKKVVACKPDSSRKSSREIFYVCKSYTGIKGDDKIPNYNDPGIPQSAR